MSKMVFSIYPLLCCLGKVKGDLQLRNDPSWDWANKWQESILSYFSQYNEGPAVCMIDMEGGVTRDAEVINGLARTRKFERRLQSFNTKGYGIAMFHQLALKVSGIPVDIEDHLWRKYKGLQVLPHNVRHFRSAYLPMIPDHSFSAVRTQSGDVVMLVTGPSTAFSSDFLLFDALGQAWEGDAEEITEYSGLKMPLFHFRSERELEWLRDLRLKIGDDELYAQIVLQFMELGVECAPITENSTDKFSAGNARMINGPFAYAVWRPGYERPIQTGYLNQSDWIAADQTI